VSKLCRSGKIFLLGFATYLAGGCATLSVRYEDTLVGANEVILRHLASPDQFLSYEEYTKLPHATSAKDHVHAVQHILVTPSLLLLRFTADCEIHKRNAQRETPNEKVVSALSSAFPEDAKELNDNSSLEGEHQPARDTSTIGVSGSTEDIWLLFDKKTNKYYLYADAKPDRKDYTTKTPTEVPVRPW
jgi:hypothetical protein